jgi:hypothetical protein
MSVGKKRSKIITGCNNLAFIPAPALAQTNSILQSPPVITTPAFLADSETKSPSNQKFEGPFEVVLPARLELARPYERKIFLPSTVFTACALGHSLGSGLSLDHRLSALGPRRQVSTLSTSFLMKLSSGLSSFYNEKISPNLTRSTSEVSPGALNFRRSYPSTTKSCVSTDSTMRA